MNNLWYYNSNKYRHGITDKIDYDESTEKWDDDSIYKLLTPCTHVTQSARKQKIKMKVGVKVKAK